MVYQMNVSAYPNANYSHIITITKLTAKQSVETSKQSFKTRNDSKIFKAEDSIRLLMLNVELYRWKV